MTIKEENEAIAEIMFQGRRDRIAIEMRQLVADAEAWNRLHPDEDPIVIDPDVTKDVELVRAMRRP